MQRKRVTTVDGQLTEVLVDEGPRQVAPHSYAGPRHRGRRLVPGTTDLCPRPMPTELASRSMCAADREQTQDRVEQERLAYERVVMAEVSGPRDVTELFTMLRANGWTEFEIGDGFEIANG